MPTILCTILYNTTSNDSANFWMEFSKYTLHIVFSILFSTEHTTLHNHQPPQCSVCNQPITKTWKNVLTSFRGYVVNNLYVFGSKPSDPTYIISTRSGSLARKRRFSTRPSGHRIRNRETGWVHVASGSLGSKLANDNRLAYNNAKVQQPLNKNNMNCAALININNPRGTISVSAATVTVWKRQIWQLT